MHAEAILDLKDIGESVIRDKRKHSQAKLTSVDTKTKVKLGNQYRYTMFGLAVFMIIGIAGLYLIRGVAPIFAIEHVQIEGEFHNEQAVSIEDALRPYLRGNLLTVDLTAAHDALAKIDWISQVQLQRSWPNAVTVNIQEDIPIARLNGERYLNDSGKVFSNAYGIETKKLPNIIGAPEDAVNILNKLNVLKTLLAKHDMQIKELSVDERFTWKLVTKKDVVFYLGRSDIESRLDRFFEVMKSDYAPEWGRIAGIDLRHSNGFAVQWHAKQIDRHG